VLYEIPGGHFKGIGKVIQGWQMGVVSTYRSGTPLSFGGGPALPLFGGGNRPNRVLGVDARTSVSASDFDPARDLYLNIAAFSQPSAFALGNVGPVDPSIRGFSYSNQDISIIKRTPLRFLTEAANIEFRAEFFNILNQVIFTNPATGTTTPTTFGKVSGQANAPRQIQFGLKINF
jgi:hypothetical protein